MKNLHHGETVNEGQQRGPGVADRNANQGGFQQNHPRHSDFAISNHLRSSYLTLTLNNDL